jgi:hypothetical protein
MLPGKDPTVILHPVPVEEPDGYRGRRRRFFMTRKGAGVALPALLVAASIVVVLIVIGVAQLLPHDAAGQIPAGGGNGAVTGDGGGGGGATDPGQPGSSAGASASGRPSKSGSPAARPGPSPSGGVAPVPVGPGAPPPAPTTSAPPRRQAVAIEAESATLGGGAKSAACTGCLGGAKVRFIGNGGSVTVTVGGVASAGTYPMTITYELVVPPTRTFYIRVNAAPPSQVNLTSSATDWSTPVSVSVQITLAAGTNAITFYNPGGNAPDLDQVTV